MSSKLQVEFKERKDEVEEYLDFILAIDEQSRKGVPRIEGATNSITVKQQRILYASVYLQLYNLIEATIESCLQYIIDTATKDAKWKPNDLSDPLWREWVSITVQTRTALGEDRRLDRALWLCKLLLDGSPVKPFKIEKGGGGNWCDAEIEKLCKKLGLNWNLDPDVNKSIKRFIRDELGPIAFVKKMRNNLAHGTISFVECTENVTATELNDIKATVIKYLDEIVRMFTSYIEEFEYLHQEKRPK